MSERPKTGKRAQVYIDARHREWWDALPRYDRSRIVAEALDLYQQAHKRAQSSAPPPTPADAAQQDAENARPR